MSTTTIEPVRAGTAELRDVKGPSALGGTPRRFFHLVWLIAYTDYKLTYFDSALGYVWSFFQPLLFFGVLYLMFAVVLAGRLSKGVHDFPVLLLMNIVLFSFFQISTTHAVPSVVTRENLVRKMRFPRLVIPLAVVTTAGIQLLLNLVVVVGFMLVYGVPPRLTWLLLPVIVLAFAVLSTGVSMLLSVLYVRYRDIAPIWAVLSQTLFYVSPIFVTIEAVEAHSRTLTRYYLFNPLAAILQQGRHWMLGHTPSAAGVMGGAQWVAVPLVLLVGIFVLGYWTFNRMAPRIAEEL